MTEVIRKKKTKNEYKKPKRWQVIFLNDDFTPFEFVVDILEKHFYKSHDEAAQFAKEVDEKGKGIAGVFTWEIAETKYAIVMGAAMQAGHPLQLELNQK